MEIDKLIEQLEDHFKDAANVKESRDSAQQVADELIALKSIFGENISLLRSQKDHPRNLTNRTDRWIPSATIRICITIPLSTDKIGQDDEIPIVKLSAILPEMYPFCDKAPQMQLLNRYIGPHGVDHNIFGEITRLYYHQEGKDNVMFTPGQVSLFDGIEKAKEKLEQWYQEQEAEAIEKKRKDSVHHITATVDNITTNEIMIADKTGRTLHDHLFESKWKVPAITTSVPITERKSIFVGHAAILEDVSQVSLVLNQILKEKKIARSTHPTIHAWTCRQKGETIIHRDCDDDGETAAGGRLAHLLDLLQLENVIIVVTRWYGGVHLGPDRFKFINRAARDALEMANLVPGSLNSK